MKTVICLLQQAILLLAMAAPLSSYSQYQDLFRIVDNGKIGYMNDKGEIVIPPKYLNGGEFNERWIWSIVIFTLPVGCVFIYQMFRNNIPMKEYRFFSERFINCYLYLKDCTVKTNRTIIKDGKLFIIANGKLNTID